MHGSARAFMMGPSQQSLRMTSMTRAEKKSGKSALNAVSSQEDAYSTWRQERGRSVSQLMCRKGFPDYQRELRFLPKTLQHICGRKMLIATHGAVTLVARVRSRRASRFWSRTRVRRKAERTGSVP